MASRTELYQITRELRRYLAWHAQSGAPGVMPAPMAEREAWQELEKAREVARAQAMREALFGESSAKPVQPDRAVDRVERGGSAAPSSSQPSSPARVSGSRLDAVVGPDKPKAAVPTPVPTGSGGGLWNDPSMMRINSRPRPTFHAVEDPVIEEPAVVAPRSSAANPSSGSSPSRQQPVNRQEQSVPVPVVTSSGPDSFEGYDESYIDYSEDMSEFNLSAPPAVIEKVVEKVVEKPVRRKEMTNAEKLAFLEKYLGDCRRCALHQGRAHVVFGEGNPEARIMFIGEGPGIEEDRKGLPFVGESGELLDKMIGAMGFKREDVYLATVVKCRSSENRNPVAGEVAECSPFLLKQIAAVQPDVIVALGGLAAQTLLGDATKLTQLRGRWHAWNKIPVMPTYNPNTLLKNDRLKRDAWSDLQMVMARLAEKK